MNIPPKQLGVPPKQLGATLITALIMLIVLTLLVISGIRSSTINLRIAGNMATQEEGFAVAQQAIEQVLSANFTANPVASNIPITIGGAAGAGGTSTYTAIVAPQQCNGSTPLTNATPNLPPQCLSSSIQKNGGIFFASGVPGVGGTSWCYAQQWDVQVSVRDSDNNLVSDNIHQGVSINVETGTKCTPAPPPI